MRILAAAILPLLMASVISAQTKSAPSKDAPPARGQTSTEAGSASMGASASKVDPAKEADIRQLLDVAGTKSLMSQVMSNMSKNLRPILTNSLPPGDYRAQVIDLFLDKFGERVNAEIPKLIEAAIPIYDKYFSDEEIKGLIQFYQTPLGRKALSALPQITIEMQNEGTKFGQQVGQETMMQVLSEHPDLAKAMQDAGTAPAH